MVLQLIGTLAMLYLPSLNAEIIDEGVVAGDTRFIVQRGGLMLAISLVQALSAVGCRLVRSAYGDGFRSRRAGPRSSSGSARSRRARSSTSVLPSLITRETNDVQQVQMLVLLGFTMMVSAPIMMVGAIVMATREDVGLSWLIVVTVPVLGGLIGSSSGRMVPSFRVMQVKIDEVNRLLREQITGIRVVRAFVREEHETERFAAGQRGPDRGRRSGPAAGRPACSRS